MANSSTSYDDFDNKSEGMKLATEHAHDISISLLSTI